MFAPYDNKDQMPELLADMSDIIGVEAINQLVEARGGGVIYIPADLSRPCVLETVLDLKEANLLREAYGPTTLYIPHPGPHKWKIEQIIGKEKASALRRARGGRNVYISKFNPKQTLLESIIGQEKAIALSKIYSGELLALPKGTTRALRAMHCRLRNEFGDGLTVEQLAHKFLVGEETVYRILNSPEDHQAVTNVGEYVSPRDLYVSQVNLLREEDLSKRLRLLCSIIGIESVRILISERGGTRVVICRSPKYDLRIGNLIGVEKAEKLLEHYLGQTMYIPNFRKKIIKIRNLAMRRDRTNGYKIAQLVQKYDLSSGYIYAQLRKT